MHSNKPFAILAQESRVLGQKISTRQLCAVPDAIMSPAMDL